MPDSFSPIPSADTVREIQRSIAADEASAAMLEAELVKLRARMANNRFLIAPVRKAPWEILTQIFAVVVADEPFFILTLSHVSRAFRHAALVSPTLWSTVEINVGHKQQATALTEVFLLRSGAVPLDVTLSDQASGETGRVLRTTTEAVMRMVHQHQSRLRSLVLHPGTLATAQAALKLCAGPAPCLEKLEVIVACDYADRNDVIPALETAFTPAPALRELKLQHCAFPPSMLKKDNVSFTLVTTFTFAHSSCSLLQLRQALSAFPNLQHLQLVNWAKEDYSKVHISLPSLTKLIIREHRGQGHAARLIDCFTAPALRNLTLEYLIDPSFLREAIDDAELDDMIIELSERIDLLGHALKGFLTRSAWPALQSLAMMGSEIPAHILMQILRKMNDLEFFLLGGTDIPKSLYKELAARGPYAQMSKQGRHPFLPRLRELAFSCIDIKPASLAKAITTRNLTPGLPIVPLEHLSLNLCRGAGKARADLPKMDPGRLKVSDNGPASPKPLSQSPGPFDPIAELLSICALPPFL